MPHKTNLGELQTYATPLGREIDRVIDEFESELPDISPRARWVIDQIRGYSARPSKRMRGSLAAAMYDHASGQTQSPAGLRLGAAIEIMQNFLLITDDVFDHSLLRRGQPTLHEAYKTEFHGDENEAAAIGVLAGGIAQHIASLALLSTDESPEHIQVALTWLQRDIAITGIGQVDDIAQSFGREFTREELLRKYHQKSSYYSLVNPLTVGLALAGRDGRADAEAYGLPAGVAFQIRDDYLGIFGDTDETGKPNLDDIHEGKHTLMVEFALEQASDEQCAAMTRILGNTDAGQVELDELRDILQSSGAAQASLDEARDYGERAKQAAHIAESWSPEFAAMLEELVDFAIERTH